MSQLANQQLDAIHSMLSAGHRNLRVERHSLVLWGVGCGGLILASNHIFTAEQYPDLKQRAFAWLILLTLAVSGIALLDWHLTRQVKQARDETWSFIHQQVLKVLWLLMAVGVLLTFATFFFGGSYMIFASWVVLVGLGLYVHGLFSEATAGVGGCAHHRYWHRDARIPPELHRSAMGCLFHAGIWGCRCCRSCWIADGNGRHGCVCCNPRVGFCAY